MDLVAGHVRAEPRFRIGPVVARQVREPAAQVAQLLVLLEHGVHLEQAQPGHGAGRAFEAERIGELAAEHLEAAADADHLAAVAQVAADRRLPALGAQPGEVGLHALGAGQHDQVGGRDRLPGADPAEIHLRVQAQRVEVGVVGDARIHRRDHAQRGRARAHVCGAVGERVLGVEEEPVQVGQHAEHRPPGARLQPVQAGLQQAEIAAEAVDHEALYPRLFRG